MRITVFGSLLTTLALLLGGCEPSRLPIETIPDPNGGAEMGGVGNAAGVGTSAGTENGGMETGGVGDAGGVEPGAGTYPGGAGPMGGDETDGGAGTPSAGDGGNAGNGGGCPEGFAGEDCSECAENHYGSGCLPCSCASGTCNEGIDGDGTCTCADGWALPDCSTCSPDYYGPDCQACDCGTLTCADGLTGDGSCYDCPEGFVGVLCDACQSGRYGAECTPCSCVNGTCNEGIGGDGACTCAEGWAEPYCDDCTPERYGATCQLCECGGGACNDGVSGDGICLGCQEGFTGDRCDECEENHYGVTCAECSCVHGTCDDGIDGDGACSCEDGWAEPSCAACEPNHYGATCQACDCGEGTCSDGTDGDGTCYDCSEGFIGDSCDECQANRFGPNCVLCTCERGDCDDGIDGDGSCDCDDGFAGPQCDQCAEGRYGPNCLSCPCDHGTCNEGIGGDGSCICAAGWDGVRCDTCDPDYYGASCTQCTCGPHGDCDDGIDGDGSCECDTGWDGPSCADCANGYFGASCTRCRCDQGDCDDGSQGSGSCDCDTGWAEPYCDTCSPDYWGATCQACSCGGGSCNDGLDGDGTCYACPPGFTGPSCNQCQDNRYGPTCALCSCVHGACDDGITGTGSCACETGWAQPSCSTCANNYYGQNCDACPTTPTEGCSCSVSNQLACAGTAQKVQLRCVSGKWAFQTTCPGSQNCNQADGTCTTIISGCLGHIGGYAFCEGDDLRRTCGPDLVTTTDVTCGGLCSQGNCLDPTCGDGKVQTSIDEECDDGNRNEADGCENDCQDSMIVKLAMGLDHSCALFETGDVRCWGDNTHNQLGLGNTDPHGTDEPYEIPLIELGGTAVDIDAGVNHTCALLSNQTVRCWGRNNYGQLGLGDNAAHTSTPMNLGAISVGGSVSRIAIGGNTSCVRLTNGDIRCWGYNNRGQLGLGHMNTVSYQQPPLLPSGYGPISIGGTATDVGVGSSHVCALLSTGRVRCWGYNYSGQLGRQHAQNIGDTELPNAVDPNVPAGSDTTGLVTTDAGRTVSTLVVAGSHSCVVFTNGTLECWGENTNGVLGIAGNNDVADAAGEAPSIAGNVPFSGDTVRSLAAGVYHHCVDLSAGGIRCWGQNYSAELGLSDITPRGNTEATLPNKLSDLQFGAGLTGTDVFVGDSHTCVLLSDGRVRCWGANSAGQLGLGYISTTPDYVGGSSALVPSLLPSVNMFRVGY
ncbi:MAG: hypothetical protein JW751_03910 [Polyangiaceae bacterium]|nr:hypothetical protein [Polyangiaceae bacterium]